MPGFYAWVSSACKDRIWGVWGEEQCLAWGKKYAWIMESARKRTLAHLHWFSQGVRSSVIVDYEHVWQIWVKAHLRHPTNVGCDGNSAAACFYPTSKGLLWILKLSVTRVRFLSFLLWRAIDLLPQSIPFPGRWRGCSHPPGKLGWQSSISLQNSPPTSGFPSHVKTWTQELIDLTPSGWPAVMHSIWR